LQPKSHPLPTRWATGIGRGAYLAAAGRKSRGYAVSYQLPHLIGTLDGFEPIQQNSAANKPEPLETS
jgi:hypothetical protein